MLPWSVMPSAGWPSAAAVGDQLVDPRRAVEHRELGVDVEVGERVAHGAAPLLSVVPVEWSGCTGVVSAPVDAVTASYTAVLCERTHRRCRDAPPSPQR